MDAAGPAATAELTRQILTGPENTPWHFKITEKATSIADDINLLRSQTRPQSIIHSVTHCEDGDLKGITSSSMTQKY